MSAAVLIDIAPTFSRVGYAEIVEEIKPLLVKHWQEIALNRDDIPLSVDYSVYENLEKAGALRIYVVRVDRALVGYAIYFVVRHPHYMSTKAAKADIYWIDPAHRNAGAGVGLFSFAEQQLQSELKPGEILNMTTGSKLAHPQAHRVLEYLGHEMIEVTHQKILRG